jgi:MFS family permease
LNAPNPPAARSPATLAAIVLVLCFACNMLGRGVADSYTVFLLPLSNEFGWKRVEVSSVYSVYLVVTGLAAPFTGMLMDRWGARVVYPMGMLLLAFGSLLAGQLHQLWQFYLCVGLLGGLGVSMLGMVPASMLISRWFRTRMSTAMGVAYAGFGSGTLVIVPLAQYAIERVGWRETYTLMGVVVLVLLPLLLLLPWREIAGERRARKAVDGAVEVPAIEAPKVRPLAAAMRTRAYWQLVQIFTFTSLSMLGVIAQVVPFLVEIGFAPLQAATAFGVAGLLSVLGMTASGWFADRVGYRTTATASFASTLVGMACLMALSFHPAGWLVVPFVLFFGISQGARGPLVASLAARHFGGGGFATIYGTMFMWMSLGGAVSTWVSGLLYDLTGGYRAGFLFAMVCVAIAVAPFWLRPGKLLGSDSN